MNAKISVLFVLKKSCICYYIVRMISLLILNHGHSYNKDLESRVLVYILENDWDPGASQ